MSRKKREAVRSGDDLKLFRMLSNIGYLLRFAWNIDKTVIVIIYASIIVYNLCFAFYDTLFLKWFIERLQDQSVPMIPTMLFAVGGTLIIILGSGLEIWSRNWVRPRFVRTLGEAQKRLIKMASRIDLICYDNKEYFNDFVIAASQAEEMIVDGIFNTGVLLGQLLGIVTLGALIMTIDPVIAIFPVLGFLINIVTRFRITKYEYDYDMEYKKNMRKADYSKRVFYQPEYAKEVKLSNIRVPLNRQFNEAVGETMREARRLGIRIAVLSLINWIGTFTLLSFFCAPYYLGYQALVKHRIALGEAAAMNNAQNGIRGSLDGLNYALVQVQRVGQFTERFRRFMEYEINIEEAEGATPLSWTENVRSDAAKGKGETQKTERGVLELKDVSFRYEGADHDTLKHISMRLNPGEKVAFVGSNGAGKTTLVKLLMRLYDVTEGSIFFDGHDIREYCAKKYRDCIGAVFQDFQLYGATLAENVKMDYVEESDRDRIYDALKLADFEEKLKQMSNGLDTEMTREFSDNGTMLSGGETQKVAVSRMFARKDHMAVAIMDEPSSALDPLAEYKLNTNIMQSIGDATVIFISHRLSTTKDADRIYMFENGSVIEEGTHEELMKKHGKYAAMFEKQAHYYQDEIE